MLIAPPLRATRLLAVLLIAVLSLAGCGGADGDAATSTSATGSESAEVASSPEDDAADEPVQVVVTTTILGDLVTDLADGAADVQVLLPPGADPHDFALSAGQAEAMQNADLLVVNGGDLEENLIDAVEAAEESGVHVFEATSAVDTIEFGASADDHGHDDEHSEGADEHSEEEDDHADEGADEHSDDEGDHADDEHAEGADEHSEEEGDHADDEHGHEGADPHFWHDPIRVASVVEALADEMAELDDTLDDDEWTARGEALAAELEALDDEVRTLLADIPEERRVLVTSHDALGYLADAYDLEVIGTVIPGGSTLAEPSAADLEELIEVVTETGVPAIFAETIDNPRLAEVVAEEAGMDVVVVELFTDSLSEADGPAPTYADLMRANAMRIADALG